MVLSLSLFRLVLLLTSLSVAASAPTEFVSQHFESQSTKRNHSRQLHFNNKLTFIDTQSLFTDGVDWKESGWADPRIRGGRMLDVSAKRIRTCSPILSISLTLSSLPSSLLLS